MNTITRRTLGLFMGAALVATGAAAPAAADSCGLTRPVKAIVGYGAGGGTDSYARILASAIPEFLDGTPMVIVNRPGGAQVPAMKFVKAADPDGVTLQVVAMGGGLMSTMLRDQGISWFDDFRPIAQFGVTNQALVVRQGTDVRTAQDLIDFIKAQNEAGETVRWSHPGRGSVSHVGVTAFLEKNGILDMTQDVPFQGGAGTRNALLSGEVDFSASGAHTLPAFSDELHAVGVLSDERDPIVDDIPTLKEQDIPFVPTSSPIVLAGPAGLSDEFVTCMSAAVEQATGHEAFKALTKKAQQAVVYRDADESLAYLQSLADAWAPTVAEVRASLAE
ncbi:tripartite tricarboxylate transporter substrate binding protein [Oricola sp.]|uniref:tripartite tricarboxylate transporter substrate binding protein n=1 Tax=Oricola sp. TaxID=1979950 RepID=UPI0025DF7881|nr:tripartite tricarboxylate transporter substrate binding protein [Oricola sp.]MCI5077384.1 tripartite tricarboxylate transporter substrate binding protein [Oricola sp.]